VVFQSKLVISRFRDTVAAIAYLDDFLLPAYAAFEKKQQLD